MTQAQQGNTVKVHYTGRLDDGSVFDSSVGGEPMEFTIGGGQMIPGFEQGVVGMELGESRTVIIAADQAYGIYRPEGVIDVARSEIPPSIPLEVGMQLQANGPDGRPVHMTVLDLSDDVVKMDGNHPLAGQDLTFEIEVVEIRQIQTYGERLVDASEEGDSPSVGGWGAHEGVDKGGRRLLG